VIRSLAAVTWGNDAFEKLFERLGQELTHGCNYLYKPMLEAAKFGEGKIFIAVNRCLDGIDKGDGSIAEGAVNALRALDATELIEHANRFRALLLDWTSRQVVCERCKIPVTGSGCDRCHVVPRTPRKDLLYLAARTCSLSIQELLQFARAEDNGIREEARRALVDLMLGDDKIMMDVLAEIRNGSAPHELVNDLLTQPGESISRSVEQVLSLLTCPIAAVREITVRLLDSGWLEASRIRAVAEHALKDPAPDVRSAAASVLRRESQI
jgi:hypothetical protein